MLSWLQHVKAINQSKVSWTASKRLIWKEAVQRPLKLFNGWCQRKASQDRCFANFTAPPSNVRKEPQKRRSRASCKRKECYFLKEEQDSQISEKIGKELLPIYQATAVIQMLNIDSFWVCTLYMTIFYNSCHFWTIRTVTTPLPPVH